MRSRWVEAVQHRQVALARHAEGGASRPGRSGLRQGRGRLEFTWNYYLDHPEFLTLLNSANLHKARHLQGSQRVREMNSPLIAMLGEILERGRKEGSFRGGIDPVQLYVSIAGLAYFYLSNSFTLSSIFGRDLLSAKARSERLSHMCDVILGYVLRN
jgi:hypothetical protein